MEVLIIIMGIMVILITTIIIKGIYIIETEMLVMQTEEEEDMHLIHIMEEMQIEIQ